MELLEKLEYGIGWDIYANVYFVCTYFCTKIKPIWNSIFQIGHKI